MLSKRSADWRTRVEESKHPYSHASFWAAIGVLRLVAPLLAQDDKWGFVSGYTAPGYYCAAGAFSRSVSDFTITYSTGMKNRFSAVETIMPPKTVVPTEWRLCAPAPLANTSGSTPRMKANEVIRMGRRRMRAASTAASLIESPLCRNCS